MTATHRVSALRRLGIWLALLLLAGYLAAIAAQSVLGIRPFLW